MAKLRLTSFSNMLAFHQQLKSSPALQLALYKNLQIWIFTQWHLPQIHNK